MTAVFQTTDNVFSDVRSLSGKDSTTLTDGTLLRLANKFYAQMVRELIGLNEDIYAEISSADLVADQREYVLPIDDTGSTYGGGLIKLQRVEITYDGTNWKVMIPTSLQEMTGPTATDANLNNQYNKSRPVYWFKDRSVWVAPVPSSSDSVAASNANLRIYWIKRPDEIAKTDIPEIPKDFLGILSEGILSDVYRISGRTSDARIALQNYQVGIVRMRELEQNIDQEQIIRLSVIRKRYD